MTNERGNPLRCIHILSSPTIPELSKGGAWRVVAEPEWKRHLEQGLAWWWWGGQIQGWGERPEVGRTPEFGSGDYPIILGAPRHRAPISSRAPYTLFYNGLYTLPPAG